ncbi:MAG: 50S ribosome-binding GTPase [Phycisphaerales bacterium]|nr:MAG: 50S ribosome-binding GTPase [Phycisphaerales bacterium]
MRNALDVIARDGSRLRDRLHLRSWSAREQELAAVLRFHHRRTGGSDAPDLVGIIGGASSGKSTIFNNLLGGRHASQVTMLSHTTRGVILAVPSGLENTVTAWIDHERILLPRLNKREANPDDRTQGAPDALTVIPVHQPTLRHVLLFDTPDFTTETARREGDLARHLLGWFDRVFVLVDEERWYDDQTFGQLRDELNRLGTARMIIFNCNEGQVELTNADMQRLREQARRMEAGHVVIEYRHGRGFRKLPDEALRPCIQWLTQTAIAKTRGSQAGGMSRRRRIARLLSDHAAHLLNEDAQRCAHLEQLKTSLNQSIGDELPTKQKLVHEVILTVEQRKLLDPYWRSLGRSVDWLRQIPAELAHRVPLLRQRAGTPEPTRPPDDEQPPNRSDHAYTFFIKEAAHLEQRLSNQAATSRFWREAGTPEEPILSSNSNAEVRSDGRRCAEACAEALERLEQRVALEAANLKINVAGAGVGLLAGVVVGSVLALPTGGLSVPAGAMLGALIAAPASGLSARACVRLYSVVRGTPESRALDDAVGEYRNALRRHAEATAERILSVARTRTLEAEPELHRAIQTLRDADTETIATTSTASRGADR